MESVEPVDAPAPYIQREVLPLGLASSTIMSSSEFVLSLCEGGRQPPMSMPMPSDGGGTITAGAPCAAAPCPPPPLVRPYRWRRLLRVERANPCRAPSADHPANSARIRAAATVSVFGG
eukprot:COSAG01_NODE_22274_length_863_cov_1.086387_2_plen_118_part_01